MTVTLNPWVAWLVVALALGGLWSACTTVADVVRGVWDWWRDRREPLTDEDEADLEDGTEVLDPLPAPRSAVELGFTGEQAVVRQDGWDHLYRPQQERKAPWYEAEYRHHYAAMQLDYPSGLLTRVREQA